MTGADFTGDGLRAIAFHSSAAPGFALVAGALSSFGPCGGGRCVALAACTGPLSRRAASMGAFLFGLMAAFAAFGLATPVFARLVYIASWSYGIVALGLWIGGVVALMRAVPARCPTPSRASAASMCAMFALGASSAVVLSPCCTPLVAAIIAYTSMSGDPLYGAGLLAAFAFGHGAPPVALALGTGRLIDRLRGLPLAQAAAVVNAVLMIVLGAFYWCLV